MHWYTLFCVVFSSLLRLVCAQGAAIVSLEVRIAMGIVTFGAVGIIFIIWMIFVWRVCHVYCYYRKDNREFNAALTRRLEREERYRNKQPHVSNAQLEAVALRNTGSPFSSPNQVRRVEPLQLRREHTMLAGVAKSHTSPYQHRLNQNSQSFYNENNIALTNSSPNSNLAMAHASSNFRPINQPEMARSSSHSVSRIARSSSNLYGIPSSNLEAGRTSNVTATAMSGVGLQKLSYVHSSHTSDQNQLTRLKIATGPSSQLQSLSEVEEMDVRPEESLQGPPRYSYLFSGTHEQDIQRIERKDTSPFSFKSERRGGSRHPGRLQEFNQLSSWPNFKL